MYKRATGPDPARFGPGAADTVTKPDRACLAYGRVFLSGPARYELKRAGPTQLARKNGPKTRFSVKMCAKRIRHSPGLGLCPDPARLSISSQPEPV
jgi:hypothetical protein